MKIFLPMRFFTALKILLLLMPFIGINIVNAQHKPWRENEMEINVKFNQPEQALLLASLNLRGDIYANHACLYVTPDDLEKMKITGLEYQIRIPDLNAWSASFGPALVPQGYYTFDQIKSIADSLATHYPSICKKVVYGFTAQNKELAALKISDNVNVHENEPAILFDGGIHGDEVGGSQNVITFARDLCKAYGSDTAITNLINNREIWLYYCVNPYGRDNMTRVNENDVDLNRDFGYAWQINSGSAGPFSQIESRALRNCQYSNQFVSYTNYHSGDQILSFPWSYRYSQVPDYAHVYNLAQVYSQSSGYTYLPYGQGSQVMYLINGSTKDFNYACLGSVAWSIEISTDKQPIGSDIQYYYQVNKPAMLALIKNIGYGISGTITDAITSKPIKASVWVDNNYPTYSDSTLGDYHKYMIPGTYNLRFMANGYQPITIANVVVNDQGNTVTDVQMQPIQSQFAFRTCMFNIPNFNAQDPGDEGYTAACLGAPDSVNYSIGKGGFIEVDMQTPVIDGPGPDIKVYEGDNTPEGYSVYALTDMDGYWNYIGSGTGTSTFDLTTAGLPQAQFFVILDDNDGTANVSNAGFDFDAIENLHAPIPDTLAHLIGKITDSLTGLPIAGAEVKIGDSTVLTDNLGNYTVNPVRGAYITCASHLHYQTKCNDLHLVAGAKTTHDFALVFHDAVPNLSSVSNITVEPNPFSNSATIKFELLKASNISIKLSSINGTAKALLFSGFCQAGKQEFPLSDAVLGNNRLADGAYLISIESNASKAVSKLIKISDR